MKKEDDIICLCNNISRSTIQKAIDEGCDTVESVCEKTGAGTACGACKALIEKMIHPREHC